MFVGIDIGMENQETLSLREVAGEGARATQALPHCLATQSGATILT